MAYCKDWTGPCDLSLLVTHSQIVGFLMSLFILFWFGPLVSISSVWVQKKRKIIYYYPSLSGGRHGPEVFHAQNLKEHEISTAYKKNEM